MILVQTRFVEAVGLAVLDFIWQGLLVWAGTALALQALRGPRARYAAACLGLALCLALPALGVASRMGGPAVVTADGIQMERTSPPLPGPSRMERPALSVRARAVLGEHLDWVVVLWAAGACLLSLRMATGLTWVRRLERQRTEPADPHWQARMERLAATLGLSRRVLLRISDAIESPVSFGWWRPVILLPAALVSGMDPLLLEALLAHELAHVRRLDYLVNLLQTGVEILLFYHPGVWWISGRMRLERELICDDLAAKALGEPRRLVLALHGLDIFQSTPNHLAQAAHGGNLMNRIRRLIHPEPRPAAWKVFVAIAGFATLCGASAAALGPSSRTPPAPAEGRAPEIPFALVTQDKGDIIRSGRGPQDGTLGDLRTKVAKDFVWFRAKGASYVVTDPSTVARARDLYKPVQDLGRRMGDLGREMGEVGKRQGGIGREQGEVGAAQGEIGRQQGELGRQMGEIGRQQGKLGRQMEKLQRELDAAPGAAAREALEKRMDGLQKSMDALDAKMEALQAPMEALAQRMQKVSEPMEDLDRRMEEAGKPMKELGARMKDLGQKMEVLNRQAMEGMHKLIDEAQATGKAVPAP